MADSKNTVVSRTKVLWLAVKLFDKSVDKATWLETIEGLSDQFDVRFLTLYRDTPMPLVAGGNPVHYVPRVGGDSLVGKVSVKVALFVALLTEVLRFRPRAVILNGEPPLLLLRFLYVLQSLFGFSCLFDVRTLPVGDNPTRGNRKLARILSFAARNFSGITYITPEMKRHCAVKFGLPPHRSAIWTSGVNPHNFVPGPFPQDRRFRLVYHGGILGRSRGIVALIDAIALLPDIPVELHLISSLRDPEIGSSINGLGLSDRVFLHETLPHCEIPAFINSCHAGVIPLPDCDGWNTSSPIKLFEYMASGRPVVVTPIQAHLNVLSGKPYAFFSSGADAKALAAAIRMAYISLPDFPNLAVFAREDALASHTWKAQSAALADFVKSLIEKQ